MKLSKIILVGFGITIIVLLFGVLLPLAVVANEQYIHDNQDTICAKADDCWTWAQGQGE